MQVVIFPVHDAIDIASEVTLFKKNTHDARSPMWMKMGKTYLFSNHSLDCETSDTGRSYLAV